MNALYKRYPPHIGDLPTCTPVTYSYPVRFVETTIFTRRITDLLSDGQYAELQKQLVENPKAGPVIPGTGGLRKLRWSGSGRGKRGGVRVIYYWYNRSEEFFMLLAFAKNEQEDLTAEQKRILRAVVDKEFE
jgi:mRNA-degrading endonuclease RelE of RelBE toxin-antitoxin system